VEFVKNLVDIFIHLDKHLSEIIQSYGAWTYSILFVIIFCETGLVVTPFLPGDSLLFAAGAFAATGSFQLGWLLVILLTAAVLGDAVNYSIGHRLGEEVFERKHSRIFKHEYLERTQKFYERYGGKTIVIARFVPIVRTFAPFLAGVGRMKYLRFAMYNVTGAAGWVFLCVLGGYFFGNLPFVRRNFSYVILAIIFISILPGLIEYIRHLLRKQPPGGDA
jgi:membrane-associated protein